MMPITRRDFLRTTAIGTTAAAWGTHAAAADVVPLIIDTHQHLWDLSKLELPWLKDAPAILNQTYHLKQYSAATAGLNIRAMYMEVHVAERLLDDEAQHVVEICNSGTAPTVAAIIGGRPASEAFPAYAQRMKKHPAVKGMRYVLHSPETPVGYCRGEQFIKGLRLLGSLGLTYDLCMRPTDLGDAFFAVEQCPDTRFILDHCGNADPRAFNPKLDPNEPATHKADDWKRGIDQLAQQKNIHIKISGVIARLPAGGDAGDLAPIVNHCLDAFGPDRVIFGSDWPVCLLGRPLKTWVDYLTQIIATRPAADREKLWSGNTRKLFALG